MAAPAMRSAFRSTATSFRASLACQSKPKPSASASFVQLPKQKPSALSQRIFLRSPVELSCCVDSLMPFHTATSSALLTSMLSASTCACRLPEVAHAATTGSGTSHCEDVIPIGGALASA